MKTRTLARLLICAAVLCVASGAMADAVATVVAPAGTTSVVTQPNGTVVFIGPLINALEPYIVSAIGALILALSAWAVALLKQKTGIAVSQANLALFQKAAATQAGVWIAQADGAAMSSSVNVGSPGIAAAANKVISRLPDEAAAIGVTPDKMADLIVGEIGKLQAVAAAPSSATKVA